MLDYIIIICNLESKHVMMYHEAKYKIRKYFDMLTIIKNILDFQFFIKNVLNKEDQEKLNTHRPLLGMKPDNIIVDCFLIDH